MYICENCQKEHNGTYGSGRFCSKACARGFSTKAKRKEINQAIKEKRKLNAHKNVFNVCKKCGKKFEIGWNKRSQLFCSRSCAAKSLSVESRNTISEKMIGKNAGEKNGMYGKSPKNTKNILVFSEKHTGNKNIKVRSSYEKIIIEQLNADSNVNFFTYEPKNFKVKYTDEEGFRRTYQPDFLVNNNEIIEVKNKWNITLSETQIKELAFREQYPLIKYTLVSW